MKSNQLIRDRSSLRSVNRIPSGIKIIPGDLTRSLTLVVQWQSPTFYEFLLQLQDPGRI